MSLGLASLALAGEGGKIDLNTATVEQLMAIEEFEMPEDLAKAIVEYREKNGPFKKADDFLKVPRHDSGFHGGSQPPGQGRQGLLRPRRRAGPGSFEVLTTPT